MGEIPAHINRTPDTTYGRLCWEQVSLPLIARQLEIKLLHLTSPMAPLLGDLRILISTCEFGIEINESQTKRMNMRKGDLFFMTAILGFYLYQDKKYIIDS